MSPTIRRILQAVLYEAIAIGFVGPTISFLFSEPVTSTIGLAACMSTVALTWNYLFNGLFEKWEAKQAVRGRSLLRRLVHGLCFEGGLLLMLVPIMAWWLDTTMLAAFMADLGILAFFLVYALVFPWAFDRIFGLPQSALPVPVPEAKA